jgi:hypothetical protein
MSRVLDPRSLGRTGLRVSPVCVGTSPFGMPSHYGYSVEAGRAVATVLAAFDSPITELRGRGTRRLWVVGNGTSYHSALHASGRGTFGTSRARARACATGVAVWEQRRELP